jgi:hypothetical protein
LLPGGADNDAYVITDQYFSALDGLCSIQAKDGLIRSTSGAGPVLRTS